MSQAFRYQARFRMYTATRRKKSGLEQSNTAMLASDQMTKS